MAATASGVGASSGESSTPDAVVSGGVDVGNAGNSNASNKTASQKVQDIFSAVDGDEKPSIPGFQERRAKGEDKQKAVKAPSAQPQKKKLEPPADAVNAGAAESHDPLADVEKFINSELNPNTEAVGEGAEEPVTDPAKRTENRFQTLANRAKSAEENFTRSQQQLQEVSGQFQNFQQQVGAAFQDMQLRNERLSTQLEMLMRGNTQEEDPETRVMKRLTDATSKELDPRFQKYESEIQQLKQHLQDRDRAEETSRNKARYQSDAQDAFQNHIMKGLSAEALTPQDRNEFINDIFSTMYERRTNAENAAKIVREQSLRRTLLFIKAFSKSRQNSQEAGAAAPGSSPAVRSGAVGGASEQATSAPSQQTLSKHGYRNPLEWMFAGSPVLT